MKFAGVVFDLDGTLIDSLGDIADSMNLMLASHGYPLHSPEAYRTFVGDGILMLIKRALPAGLSEAEYLAQKDEYAAIYRQNLQHKTKPYPGIPELLRRLEAAGLRLAVVSNKPHDATGHLVRSCFPEIRFAAVLGQRDGVPRKPDPAGPLEAAQAMGLEPARIAYVGDSGVDMHTARNAGMTPCGVLWGFRGADELRESGAAALCADPEALYRAITE